MLALDLELGDNQFRLLISDQRVAGRSYFARVCFGGAPTEWQYFHLSASWPPSEPAELRSAGSGQLTLRLGRFSARAAPWLVGTPPIHSSAGGTTFSSRTGRGKGSLECACAGVYADCLAGFGLIEAQMVEPRSQYRSSGRPSKPLNRWRCAQVPCSYQVAALWLHQSLSKNRNARPLAPSRMDPAQSHKLNKPAPRKPSSLACQLYLAGRY